jgi:hypothetical protein
MKAALFTILRAFSFELAVPVEDIRSRTMIVQRPIVKNDLKAGTQLPMIIKVVGPKGLQ